MHFTLQLQYLIIYKQHSFPKILFFYNQVMGSHCAQKNTAVTGLPTLYNTQYTGHIKTHQAVFAIPQSQSRWLPIFTHYSSSKSQAFVVCAHQYSSKYSSYKYNSVTTANMYIFCGNHFDSMTYKKKS